MAINSIDGHIHFCFFRIVDSVHAILQCSAQSNSMYTALLCFVLISLTEDSIVRSSLLGITGLGGVHGHKQPKQPGSYLVVCWWHYPFFCSWMVPLLYV